VLRTYLRKPGQSINPNNELRLIHAAPSDRVIKLIYDQKQIVEELLMLARHFVHTLCIQILITLSVNQVSAACIKPPLTAEVINQFKSNPQALVAPNSDTRTIDATTRDLAGTDGLLAADLVRVAEGTVPRFRTAIAAGLAQAAITCSTVDQQQAQMIQQAVASFQDGEFQASFAAVAGDLSTAATAAATAFATGSVGSVVVTNPNTSAGSATAPGGGGGALAPLQLTAAGLTLSQTTPVTTNSTSTSAGDSVSATR
jgi:hypothetical protein